MRLAKSALLAGLLIGGTVGAVPEVRAADPAPEKTGDWTFGLGAMGFVAPDYEGSDDYEASALPLVDIEWQNRIRLTTKGGPGLYADLLKANGFAVTAGVSYDFGRDEDDNDALQGLGDLEVGAVGNLELSYGRGPWGLSLGLARDLGGDREGLSAKLGAEYGHVFYGGRLVLKAAPYVTWADESYMENSFGISDVQAAASGRGYSPYEAGAGLKDVGIGLTAVYRVTSSVSLLGRVGYSQLLGDAADSPLVDQEGSAGQMHAGLGLVYRW